ncbi:MAG: site-specific integrase, partial [Gammaproteobacteria bacterium]|nr:site-specific integrase [Gammaproteobacteria bacterium]
ALGSLPHLRRHLGLYRVNAITFDRVSAYKNARLDEGAAPATVKYELATLRKGLRIAMQSGKLVRVPHMPEIKVENTRSGFFELEEFRAVRAELPPELGPLVEVAYWTGWRIRSELLPMEWSQIDLEAGTMRLEPGTTKNGKGRTFPIDLLTQLYGAIKAQREYTERVQRESGRIIPWVFHRDGEPIRDMYGAWRAACKRAGLEGKLPHDFRRTAVRNLERAGVSRSAGMQLTGHLTEAVYRRYAITNEADLKDAVAKLAGLQNQASRKILPISVTSRSQKQAANA